MAENSQPPVSSSSAESGAGRGTSGNGASAPVAPVPPTGPTGNVAVPVSAKESVSDFGGNATGRKGRFKFPPDTPRGIEERRQADAQRKRESRGEIRRATEPPPLPSADAPLLHPSLAPGNGQIPVAPVAPVEPCLPWTAADVKEFTDELVDLSETKRLSDFVSVAREAKLPESLVREIEKDARYPVKSKAGLKTAIAAVSAKWLTRSGISARNKEEAAFIFFGAGIWLQGRRLRGKLDELIEEDRKRQEAEKKKSSELLRP